jgi:hypothetical protein
VTWKPNLFLYFLAQIPIYASCSGEESVYASCKAVRDRICGKIYIFSSGFIKKGMISLHRKMDKRPSVQDSHGEVSLSITISHCRFVATLL